MSDFANSMKIGKIGEVLIRKYLEQNGYECRKSEHIQERKGIDLLACKDNKYLKLEIKTDVKGIYTGNIFIEIQSVMQKDIKGWLHTSNADIIFYIIAQKLNEFIIGIKTVYCMHMEDLRNYLTEEKISNLPKGMAATSDTSDRQYNTLGVLLPITELEEQDFIIKLLGSDFIDNNETYIEVGGWKIKAI